jgi:hypothetical protein
LSVFVGELFFTPGTFAAGSLRYGWTRFTPGKAGCRHLDAQPGFSGSLSKPIHTRGDSGYALYTGWWSGFTILPQQGDSQKQ